MSLEKKIEELEAEVKKNTRWRRFEQLMLCISLFVSLAIWLYLYTEMNMFVRW